MKVLVTGASGFVGKNLCANLKNIRDGKDKREEYQKLLPLEIFEYSHDSPLEEFDRYCSEADFVFNLAGVNRPDNPEKFIDGNIKFVSNLLECLERHKNNCPVMMASSIQASLIGRYKNSEYGKSKLKGEKLVREHGKHTHAPVLIYRFPNLFGKWCRPNYNSAVATFCYNIAHDLPIHVDNITTTIELLYIDDLVDEMLNALLGQSHCCRYEGIEPIPDDSGDFCYVPVTHKVTLGQVVELLESFSSQPQSLLLPEIPEGSFSKKLYSTYLSYLPKEKIAFPLKMNSDERGSFTEILKTHCSGQLSVNISRPGVTKGMHWHNTKWEFFIVVSGEARIRERNLDTNEVVEFEVTGEKIQAVHMLPGYTHEITNLSDKNDLITVMWANENFSQKCPDTFFEEI